MRPTQCLLRQVNSLKRLPLTTKQAGKDYYKGTGSGAMGRHTKHGGYVIDYSKVRTYMVPSIPENFALTPFVTRLVERRRGKKGELTGPVDGASYLQQWMEHGVDVTAARRQSMR